MSRQVTWRLTLEPAGADVAWSLLRADDGRAADAVAGGIARDLRSAEALARGLPPRPGPEDERGWTSDLLDPVLERTAAVALGAAMLPEQLRSALLADCRVTDGEEGEGHREPRRHTVEIAVRGWVSTLPWEALAVDARGAVRLVEAARIVAAMPPGLVADRARTAHSPGLGAPGLAVVDPGPPLGPLGSIYAGEPERYPRLLTGAGGLERGDLLAPGTHPMSSTQWGRLLADAPWSRLLYLGHVLAPWQGTPPETALLFERAGAPDPLSAGQWLAEPDRWPAPERVALIACASDGATFREASGLPVAAVNAGARLVTTTRWALPSDGLTGDRRATTMLALAVHRAHCHVRPISALRDWQRIQLARWRAGGHPSYSPLWWATLSTYAVPPEAVPVEAA